MTAKMVKCPRCEGGKQTMEVIERIGNLCKVTECKITCLTCNGRGELPNKELQKQERAFKAFWCDCGNASGNVTYHDDNTSRNCRKHHWTCDDCGKVTQVG